MEELTPEILMELRTKARAYDGLKAKMDDLASAFNAPLNFEENVVEAVEEVPVE